MAEMLASGPGCLSIYDTHTGELRTAIGSLTPEVIADYMGRFHQASPFFSHLTRLRAGERFNRREYMPDSSFENSGIYREFYSKVGIYHLEYQVFLVRNYLQGGVLFSRPRNRKNFGREELEALAFIMPHLGRAFEVYIELSEIRRKNKIMFEAFGRIPQSVLVVDAAHKLVFANHSGNEVLEKNDGFNIDSSGRLRASSPISQKSLRSVLEFACSSSDKGNGNGSVLQVSRPSGMRPIEVLISPFTSTSAYGSNPEGMAMLFISNAELSFKNIGAMLSQMYGLTAAEARIAALLADGHSINESCELLSIKQNTARTHLKHIFSKTATNRQSELIKLINIGPGSLRENSAADQTSERDRPPPK
jgi:DNA-binding CsgD family transcriptional regulator